MCSTSSEFDPVPVNQPKRTARFQPMGDRVLVLPNPPEESTRGGIALPDAAKEIRNMGRVLAIGPDVEHIQEGEQVMYPKFAGTEIEDESERYLFLSEEDIIAKVIPNG